jgi:predicted ATPase
VRDTAVTELHLQPLQESEARALVDALGRATLAAPLREQLLRAAEGHPLFLRELLVDALSSRPALAPLGDDAAGARPLPRGVGYFLERRLSALSDEARALLTAASCAPGCFSFEAVRGAAQLSADAALPALEEALAAGLVRCEREPDEHAFVHGLVRSFLSARTSAVRRAHLMHRLAPGGTGTRGALSTGAL